MIAIEFTNAKDTTQQIWLEVGKIRTIDKISATNLSKEKCAIYYKKKTFLVAESYDEVLSKLTLAGWKPKVSKKDLLAAEQGNVKRLTEEVKQLQSRVKYTQEKIDSMKNKAALSDARTIFIKELEAGIETLRIELSEAKATSEHFRELNIKNVRDHEAISRDQANTPAQFTLGMLIDALKKENSKCEETPKVYFDFCNTFPVEIWSYRGDYSQLALSWSTHESQFKNESLFVEDLIKILEAADGNVFQGYKGGSYKMDRHTLVWVDNSGKYTGTAIVGVSSANNTIYIKTADESCL